MLQIQKLRIYFGNAETSISKTLLDSFATSKELSAVPIIAQLTHDLALTHVSALHQVHGTAGQEITEHNIHAITPDIPGDYLITQITHVGLAVFTADCIPIIFYDSPQEIIAIAHAGWRGSVSGIAIKVLSELEKKYGSSAADLQVIFGPSAQHCCYEVGPEFLEFAYQAQLPDKIISKRENKFFFNVPEFNKQLLASHGVRNFNFDYSRCTMCNTEYSSHRRERNQAKRQITLVALV